MIVYFHFLDTNNWGRLSTSEKKSITLEPEEMPMALSDDLSRNGNEYIYISPLSDFLEEIIEVINISGFNLVEGNPKLKQMKSKDCKYLIGGNGIVYNFVAKWNKSVKYLYDLNNITKMSWEKISETFCGGEPTHEKCLLGVVACINNLNGLCSAKRSIPCTITGYAKRVFQRSSGFKILENVMEKTIGNMNAEEWIRRSYHGGFNYINRPGVAIEEEGEGIVLDINSLYPYIMATKPMPCGDIFSGKGKPDDKLFRLADMGFKYLYLHINVAMRLKPGGIRCIKVDNKFDEWYFYDTDYLVSTQRVKYKTGERSEEYYKIPLTLTYSDYKLMLDNYEILDIEYVEYAYQNTTKLIFKEYVNTFYRLKQKTEKPGERFVYKMLLNSLSGLMARLPEFENFILTQEEDGSVSYEIEKTYGTRSFIDVGTAITAYGREIIINFAKANIKRWRYSDTDSLHLIGKEIPEGIKIGNGLGEWKVEHEFDKACYFVKKGYAFVKNNKLEIIMAGVRLDDKKVIERVYNLMHSEEKKQDNELFDPWLNCDERKEVTDGLCVKYGEINLTEREKTLWKEHIMSKTDDELLEDIKDSMKELTTLIVKINKERKKIENFETNLELISLGSSYMPSTDVYKDDAFSKAIRPRWEDYTERKKFIKKY